MTLEKLLKNLDESDAQKVSYAFEFAKKAHAGQKRVSGEDYIMHPVAVAGILKDLRMDTDTLIAALLHDTLEDTLVTEEQLIQHFGNDIVFLVKAVTKIKSVEEKGTQATSYQTLMRMFFAMASDIRVILIKLADQLHNLQTLGHMPPDHQKQKAMRSLEIYAPIAERLNIGELKGDIEDLAFSFAYPDIYNKLIEETQPYYHERQEYTARILPIVKAFFEANHITIRSIDSRIKHKYSLYKKLLRKENNMELIYDLVAFRVVVDDIATCYEALGALHQKYRPLPKHIKDYIAIPKPNGYKSLHTTLFCEEGQIVEFQIRTNEMHEHAERGIAAHWAYSELNKSKLAKAEAAELAWVNKIREWRKYIESPKEFFDALRLDMFKNRIFVFTPKGDIKDLPEGATPIDFAYAIHSDIGDHCTGAKINGKIVPLKYHLQNGDVCAILTSKNQKPSHDWLGYTQTSDARRHIRNFLNLKK